MTFIIGSVLYRVTLIMDVSDAMRETMGRTPEKKTASKSDMDTSMGESGVTSTQSTALVDWIRPAKTNKTEANILQ
jgi:hypothetical protein